MTEKIPRDLPPKEQEKIAESYKKGAEFAYRAAELINKQPFRPLRILMKNGNSYAVNQPSWLSVSWEGFGVGREIDNGVPKEMWHFAWDDVRAIEEGA